MKVKWTTLIADFQGGFGGVHRWASVERERDIPGIRCRDKGQRKRRMTSGGKEEAEPASNAGERKKEDNRIIRGKRLSQGRWDRRLMNGGD